MISSTARPEQYLVCSLPEPTRSTEHRSEQVNSSLRGAKPSVIAQLHFVLPACWREFPSSCVCEHVTYMCVSASPATLPPSPVLARSAATSALLSSLTLAYLLAHAEFSAKSFDDDGQRQLVPSPYQFGQLSTSTAASVFTFLQRDEGQSEQGAGGRSHWVCCVTFAPLSLSLSLSHTRSNAVSVSALCWVLNLSVIHGDDGDGVVVWPYR